MASCRLADQARRGNGTANWLDAVVKPWRALLAAVIVAVLPATGFAAERDVLRVCADPDYLPFSDRNGAGFENKLAEILATDLGVKVEYEWFPQRMGFIRNTLRAEHPTREGYKCDVVMGVPTGFELAITTKTWYRSTYSLVYVKGRGLDDVQSARDLLQLDEAKLTNLRIGIHERSPGALWLAKNDLFGQMVPYIAQQGDPDVSPNELEINDLLAGELDAAILWGPIAGHATLVSKDAEVEVIPLKSEPGVRFHFGISAAVRFGEGEWRDELNTLLERNAEKIEALMRDYKVPTVDENGT